MISLKMKIEENKSLKEYNQFGIDVKAKYFVTISNIEQLKDVLTSEYSKGNVLILGEGNNILFTKDFEGLVIQPNIKGKKIIEENNENIFVEVSCGENWDDFVKWAVENHYQGIENLILIPSSIGGAVSQNIAAYGQNIMDVVTKVYATEIATGKEKIFEYEECEFRYRESIIKDADSIKRAHPHFVENLQKLGANIEWVD